MSTTYSVLFYGVPDQIRDRLTMSFQDSEFRVIGEIPSEEQVMSRLELERPDILFLSSADSQKLQHLCQQIYVVHPRCMMIMLGDSIDQELRESAHMAGVRAVLAPVPPTNELVTLVKSLCINENSHISGVMGASSAVKRSETVCLLSAKGGLGKTTAAVNLAVALAMEQRRVALLDLDLQFAGVDLFLGLTVKGTLAELLMEQSDPTLDVVNSYLLSHISGLKVLPAPSRPEFAESISPKSVEKVVRLLQNYYDYIILDTAVGFNEINLAMMDVSNHILLVTDSTLSCLRNTKKMLLVLEDLKLRDRVKLVLRKTEDNTVTQADVERILQQKVGVVLENDPKTAGAAINQGQPVVLQSGKIGQLSRSLNTLPALLRGVVAAQDEGRGGRRKKVKKVKEPKPKRQRGKRTES